MAIEALTMAPWGHPQVNVIGKDRLHLQHGPIDLVIRAEGSPDEIKAAYAVAILRFEMVLHELTDELPLLRQPLKDNLPAFQSVIAQRMAKACWPYRHQFITPMAAVAGSVADDIKSVMLQAAPELRTLYVNNGGDIAVHVSKGAILKIGLVADLAKAAPEGVITVESFSGIGGIATSGWRGRSFSRGIADAVTVLGKTGAQADAAATIIANAVDVRSDAVQRVPAQSLDPDCDLKNLLVTKNVGPLSPADILLALENGERIASALLDKKHILGCLIALKDNVRCIQAQALNSSQADLGFPQFF
jgi:uncharacterized protein